MNENYNELIYRALHDLDAPLADRKKLLDQIPDKMALKTRKMLSRSTSRARYDLFYDITKLKQTIEAGLRPSPPSTPSAPPPSWRSS